MPASHTLRTIAEHYHAQADATERAEMSGNQAAQHAARLQDIITD